MGMRMLKTTGRFVVCAAALAQVLAGCGSSSRGGSPLNLPDVSENPLVPELEEPPADELPAEPSIAATHGYFVGGLENYYAEALLTVDGMVRIFVWGAPGTRDEWVSPQLVGNLEFADGEAQGTGLMYSRVCEIDGTWPRTTYLEPATLEFASGLYDETLSGAGIISVDNTGRFFFQGPFNGCVGNGTLVPHGDAMFNVYDVELLVENCIDEYAANNTMFKGLASRSIGSDSWGDWLVFWLSTEESAPLPVSLVLWGLRI